MTKEWSDPRLEALDVVREAMRQIYDAKRARMATAKDDVRLRELHVQRMAVMRRFGNEGADDYAALVSVERPMANPWRRAPSKSVILLPPVS
jgi:hypothetical protein